MITIEQLQASRTSERFGYGRIFTAPSKGLLTKAEAQERIETNRRLVSISSFTEGVYFFADDHCYGFEVLPDHFVSSTSSLPMAVTARESLPTGIITNIDEYISIFYHDQRLIESLEELVEFVNRPKPEPEPVPVVRKPKQKAGFNVGHFPVGTIVEFSLPLHHDMPTPTHGTGYEVKGLIKNGYDSYLVDTGIPHDFIEDTTRSYHIDHVSKILKRGDGPVLVENAGEKPGEWAVEEKRIAEYRTQVQEYHPVKKGTYVYPNEGLLILLAVSKMKTHHTDLLNTEAMSKLLVKQGFVKTVQIDERWMTYRVVNKKRLKKFVKANYRRFLLPVKKTQKQYDDEMSEQYYADLEREEW